MLDKIREKVKEINKKKEELNKEIGESFSSCIAEIMSKVESINSVSFTCYTPYFNDGDECIYSANIDDLDINGSDEYDSEFYISYENKHLSRDEKVSKFGEKVVKGSEVINEISEFLGELPEDFYRSTFGDHVKVTLNKDGSYATEKYDHD